MQAKTYTKWLPNGNLAIYRRSDGQCVELGDVGRCYRLYYSNGYCVDIARGAVTSWGSLVRTVRRRLLRNTAPILDVHATGRFA